MWLSRRVRDGQVIEIYRKAAGQLRLFPRGTLTPDTFVYAGVPWTAVRHLPAARATLRWAVRDLGIRRPKLAFFVPLDLAAQCGATSVALNDDIGLLGITWAGVNVIYVNALLPKREMVDVVAHECKHVALHSRDVGEPASTTATRETEALRYGRRVARATCARRTGFQPTPAVPRPPRWTARANASGAASARPTL